MAKVYRKEAGIDFVDRIRSETGSQYLISRLTIVEMESVFALKARAGEIDQKAVLIARRRLEADLGHRRLLVAATNTVTSSARLSPSATESCKASSVRSASTAPCLKSNCLA